MSWTVMLLSLEAEAVANVDPESIVVNLLEGLARTTVVTAP